MLLFNRIKDLCDKHKISPTKLSLELGYSKDTVNSWKSKSPSANNLQAVADYFNVSLDYLMGRTDDPRMRDGNDIFSNLAEDERTASEAFLKTYREQKNKM